MRTETLTCDRCGENATEWVRVFRHELLDGMRAGAHDLREVDLCPACAHKLFIWLDKRKD